MMALGQGGIANTDNSAKARGLLQKVQVHWHFSCACKSMHQKPFMHAAVPQDVTDVIDVGRHADGNTGHPAYNPRAPYPGSADKGVHCKSVSEWS